MSNMQFSALHSKDAEIATLASVLIDNFEIPPVRDILEPEDFWIETHRVLYKAILHIYDQHESVDFVLLTEHLRTTNQLEKVGGFAYIKGVIDSEAVGFYAQQYAHKVHEYKIYRDIVVASSLNQQDIKDGLLSVEQVIEKQEERAFNISKSYQSSSNDQMLKGVLEQSIQEIERKIKEGEPAGIDTGLIDLNEMLSGGFKAGQLVVLGARPSMGKTALMLTMLMAAAKSGTSLMFEVEMRATDLGDRLLSMYAKVDSTKIQNHKLLKPKDVSRLKEAQEKIENSQLLIDDSEELTLRHISSVARKTKLQYPDLNLICVDYLQQMATAGKDTNFEYGLIAQGLKRLARKLDCTIVLASQLSRAVESTPDKKPMISHLRESGRIEEAADIVILLYRAAYYFEEADPTLAELIIGKHRNGRTGIVNAAFMSSLGMFGNSTRGRF